MCAEVVEQTCNSNIYLSLPYNGADGTQCYCSYRSLYPTEKETEEFRVELQDQKTEAEWGRGMGEVDIGQVRTGSLRWGARFWKRAAMWGEAGDDQQQQLCERWDRAEETRAEYHKWSQQSQGESPQRSHSKQHRVGPSGFMYVDLQKHAFSQRIVLGTAFNPKREESWLWVEPA